MASCGIGRGVRWVCCGRAGGLVGVGHGEQNQHGGCEHVGSTCRGGCALWGLGTRRWAGVYGVVSAVAGACRMRNLNVTLNYQTFQSPGCPFEGVS